MRVDTRVAIAASFAIIAFVSSCSDDAAQPGQAQPGPGTFDGGTLDRAGAIAAAIDVRTDGCGPRVGFGTGSVIDSGDIVTAAHVVAGTTSVEVIDVDGVRSGATVIVFDPDLDFAVLRPATPVGTPLAMRRTDATAGEAGIVVLPRLTDDVVETDVATVIVIRVANIKTTDIHLEHDVVRQGYEIEGSIDPGDSGSMVVLPGGGAGIVWARSNRNARRAWAIDLPADVLDGSALGDDPPPVDLGDCVAE